jgi:hypothetical protein
MGLSTTPATGSGGAAGGAGFSYYAIAHNAATFPRKMTIRYDVDPETEKRLGNPRIEVIGERPRDFKSGETLVLENMQPGENRWIGVTFNPPSGKEGERLVVNFSEMVGNSAVNGFSLGVRLGPMGRVIRDNLEFHRSIVTRLAMGFQLGSGKELAEIERMVKDKDVSKKDYLKFLATQTGFMEEASRYLMRSHEVQDAFGILEARNSLSKAIQTDDAEAVAVAHSTLLNKLDSFITMVQLSKGDTADILQNVRWQNELYEKVPSLARLSCAGPLRNASHQFVRGYGMRKVRNQHYPEFIRGVRKCFDETAKATNLAGLNDDITAMDHRLADLTALQKAHRDYLLKLQKLAKY